MIPCPPVDKSVSPNGRWFLSKTTWFEIQGERVGLAWAGEPANRFKGDRLDAANVDVQSVELWLTSETYSFATDHYDDWTSLTWLSNSDKRLNQLTRRQWKLIANNSHQPSLLPELRTYAAKLIASTLDDCKSGKFTHLAVA